MRIYLLAFFIVMLNGGAVMATDISVFQRDLYDRIIIDGAGNQPIQKNDDVITVPLTKAIDGLDGKIGIARTIQNATMANNQLMLSTNSAVTDTRHFRIGNRVILDVFYNADDLQNLVSPQITDDKPQENVEVVTNTSVAQETVEQPKLRVVDDGDKAEATPELPVALTRGPLTDETIVTISNTVPFGLATFERFGRLFVVADENSMAIPPQVSGNGAELGWVFTEIPMAQGKAWMMPLPQGSFVRPEGRGLIWRLIISDNDPNLSTADIRRRMTNPKDPKIDILMPNYSSLLRLEDPDYGDALAIITVKNAQARMAIPYDFVDFDIMPAIVGSAIKPETDGLRISSASQFITITGRNGLSVAENSQNPIVGAYLDGEVQTMNDNVVRTVTTLDRVFFFNDWGGGIDPYEYVDKRKELDQFLALSPAEDKLSVLLDLVKLTLSQGMGQETLGYLKLAEETNRQIAQTSEFQALKGAARFLSHQYDLAEDHFGGDNLSNIAEARLWYAASLAANGKYEQAMEVYSDNATLSTVYPPSLIMAVNAPLALAALDLDQGQKALEFVELMDKESVLNSAEDRATVAYLKGRAQTATGRPDEAISNLYMASRGDKLGPFGIRSELLLVRDELAREVITPEEAVKRMERLRFAWRGDALETQIQQALGELYIDNNQPRQGLAILKRAATNTPSAVERRRIVRKMAEAFKSIFLSDDFEKTDPLIGVAVYDEFKELTPVGDEGNMLIDRIADKLMSVNLASRATRVLGDKMNRLGEGQHAIETGMRIARIQLLDREPEEALKTLAQVDEMMRSYRGDDKDDINRRIVLLKAKGLADTGEPQQALFMTEGLDDTDEVIRLRIDTAWKTGKWVAASDNLSKLLARQNITPANPPTNDQAQLILNQAVALSLSNQYDALQRFASQYDMAMKQTPAYKTFLVVTRPQNISNLADRETLLDVTSEVDLFKDFLETVED